MRARNALISQRICREWQVVPSGQTMQWQVELNDALVRLFVAEKVALSVMQLFAMIQIRIGDMVSKVWHLNQTLAS
jgi:hypothetical protein